MKIKLRGDILELADFAKNVYETIQKNAIIENPRYNRELVSVDIEIPERIIYAIEWDENFINGK